MKLLRNPVAVGVLALLAVALVFKSLWPVLRGRSAGRTTTRRAPPPPPALAPAPAPASAVQSPSTAPAPAAVALERSSALPAMDSAAGVAAPSEIDLDLVRA